MRVIPPGAPPKLVDHVCLRGGRVIDPRHDIDRVTDVVIKDGRIESVGECRDPNVEIIDVSGKLVVPGLIDQHAHIYHGVSAYGIHPDRAGVRMGVTHVNDTGSVGWITFSGFREVIVKRAQTNITCSPNMLSCGLPDNYARGATELVNEKYYPELLAEQARNHPSILRGVKVWVERGFLSHLDDTWRAFRAARQVTEMTGINLYVHLGDLFPKNQSKDLLEISKMIMDTVERMRPGEMLGHCFTQFPGGLVDDTGKVHPAAKLATEMGVLHEVGHGNNFCFFRARNFLDAGNRVDIISSDLHGVMHAGKPRPGHGLDSDIDAPDLDYSFVATMSKCLALGMSLTDVVRASSLTPAKALRLDTVKGSLTPGFNAEISILDLVPGTFTLVDSVGDRMPADYLFLPVHTIIGNRMWQCDPFVMPEILNDYVRNNPGAFDDHVKRYATDASRSTSTSPPPTVTG